uniref:Uncharacterized protein n=1 Tax=Chromera velia CCMP2878 TaxID=1169474 RepID=A0A0K6S983_9ALVE|eukprot:Cvel_1088.t2-p1 / transcript=Cvel_1088.t2 / gene=Cvel_1088 / organism=Chromera_velia_CCMP2878 / gene_product=hypothetical protein / transcript_product=hypothetical protein / location=Cvel_scaffold35:86849-91419(+) / protein_length=741 / sequence_SO=supercontig / SO=protein_coding / is_pseudo=false
MNSVQNAGTSESVDTELHVGLPVEKEARCHSFRDAFSERVREIQRARRGSRGVSAPHPESHRFSSEFVPPPRTRILACERSNSESTSSDDDQEPAASPLDRPSSQQPLDQEEKPAVPEAEPGAQQKGHPAPRVCEQSEVAALQSAQRASVGAATQTTTERGTASETVEKKMEQEVMEAHKMVLQRDREIANLKRQLEDLQEVTEAVVRERDIASEKLTAADASMAATKLEAEMARKRHEKEVEERRLQETAMRKEADRLRNECETLRQRLSASEERSESHVPQRSLRKLAVPSLQLGEIERSRVLRALAGVDREFRLAGLHLRAPAERALRHLRETVKGVLESHKRLEGKVSTLTDMMPKVGPPHGPSAKVSMRTSAPAEDASHVPTHPDPPTRTPSCLSQGPATGRLGVSRTRTAATARQGGGPSGRSGAVSAPGRARPPSPPGGFVSDRFPENLHAHHANTNFLEILEASRPDRLTPQTHKHGTGVSRGRGRNTEGSRSVPIQPGGGICDQNEKDIMMEMSLMQHIHAIRGLAEDAKMNPIEPEELPPSPLPSSSRLLLLPVNASRDGNGPRRPPRSSLQVEPRAAVSSLPRSSGISVCSGTSYMPQNPAGADRGSARDPDAYSRWEDEDALGLLEGALALAPSGRGDHSSRMASGRRAGGTVKAGRYSRSPLCHKACLPQNQSSPPAARGGGSAYRQVGRGGGSDSAVRKRGGGGAARSSLQPGPSRGVSRLAVDVRV